MADLGPLGGVKITGFISPTDTNDTYAVIDPIYGIDGLRNLTGGTADLDLIPDARRRTGMLVGVQISGGTEYYQLLPSPWSGTFSDWSLLNIVGVTGITDTYWTSGSTGTGSIKTVLGSNTSTANYSVAEGSGTTASGNASHTEGFSSIASGDGSHAEGGFIFIDACTTSLLTSETYVVPSYVGVDSINCDGIDYITYTLSVTLTGTSSNIHTIYGNSDNPMVFPPAYQAAAPFGANIGGTNAAFWAIANTCALGYAQYDSWLTVGITIGDTGGALSSIGLDLSGWGIGGSFDGTNGGVFWFDPNDGPSGTVVVAQITIPSGTTFDVRLNAQGRSVTGEDWYQEDIQFTNGTPYTPPSPLPSGKVCNNDRADTFEDGSVAVDDLLELLTSYGGSGDPGMGGGPGTDINEDGIVNIDDLQLMLNAYGQTVPMTVTTGFTSTPTLASGDASHAEGSGTMAIGDASHSEGFQTIASGQQSHAEGWNTTASGDYSHAGGVNSTAYGENAHAQGWNTTASGITSHAEGSDTTASGDNSHAQGWNTTASGQQSHAEGWNTTASGNSSHAEGRDTIASGQQSHAEGWNTQATGIFSHAEGQNTLASGDVSHAEGKGTIAGGLYSHAEGIDTTASGTYSHAEGLNTTAIGGTSHAEGSFTIAGGSYSHAGGYFTTASGLTSFIHSTNSTVTGDRSVVLGGTGITGATDDTVYVPKLNLDTALANDNVLTQVLVRAADGTVKYKDTSSFTDLNVTGGTYDINTGIVEFTNNTGTTFEVSGFTSGMTDSFTTTATTSGNEIQFDNNIQGGNLYNVDLTPMLSGFTGNQTLSETLVLGNESLGNDIIMTSDIVIGEVSGIGIKNTTDDSKLTMVTPSYTAFQSQGTNEGALTGFSYSFFSGFNITSIYTVGTPLKVVNTQNGSNDGTFLITGIDWDGVTNWIQWSGMTTEVAAPYGDYSFTYEGVTMSSTIIDVLGTKEASMYCNPNGAYMRLTKGTYGQPGYLHSAVSIIDNFDGNVGGYFTYDGYPIVVGGQDYTIQQGVVSSVVGPGRQANVKTNYATYTENIAFNRTGGGTETLVSADKTTNIDRLQTLQDADGIIALVGDAIPATGNTSGTCITDLYVSNIHSCSPLYINPLDEGNLYYGGDSGFTIDISNSGETRVGINDTNPGYGLSVRSADAYFDRNAAIGANVPDTSHKLRVTTSDTDGGNMTGARIDLSHQSSSGSFQGLQIRSTAPKSAGSSTVFGVNSNLTGSATAGSHTFIGGRFRAATSEAGGTANNYALQLEDGSEGTAGHVWTSVDTTGLGHWGTLGSGGISTDTYVSGATLVGDEIVFDKNDSLSAFTVDLTSIDTGIYVGSGVVPTNTTATLTDTLTFSGSDDTSLMFVTRNSSGVASLQVNGYGDVFNYGRNGNVTNTSFGLNTFNVNGISSASHNTAFGTDAMSSNLSGYSNVAIGHSSMKNVVEGDNNTAVGRSSMSGGEAYDSVAVGSSALLSIVGGTRCVAVGANALLKHTVGTSTGVGYFAGGATTGAGNTSVGHNAASGAGVLGTHSYTTSVGDFSLYRLETGDGNVAFGKDSGFNTKIGGDNTFIGYAAGRSNVSGNTNVFLGYQAGYHEGGDNKLYIDNDKRGGDDITSRTKSLVYGTFDATQSNQEIAFNVGTFRLPYLATTPVTGYVLKSIDSLGNSDWGTLGAAGISGDTYVSGATLVGDEIVFDKNDSLSAFTVDLSGFSTGQTLSETLVFGNTTGGNDIVINDNDLIKSLSGTSQLLIKDNEIAIQHGVFGVDKVQVLSLNLAGSGMLLTNSGFTKTGQITINDNDAGDVNTGNVPQYPTALSSQNSILKQNVVNTNILGGLNVSAKTDNTAYVQQLGYNNGAAFETLVSATTATADRIQTHQDADGIIALVGDLSGFGTTNKYVITTGFTADTIVTITHSLGVSDECSVSLRDTVTNEQITGAIDNFTTNTLDVTLSETLTAVKIVIIG